MNTLNNIVKGDVSMYEKNKNNSLKSILQKISLEKRSTTIYEEKINTIDEEKNWKL